MIELAKVAYAAYIKDITHVKMPPWEQLGLKTQECWVAAVSAVVDHLKTD